MTDDLNDVNGEGVEHDATAILARMEIELRGAGAAGAAVWPTIRSAAAAIPHRRYSAIVLTGCGDSYYAALGLRGALEAVTGVPVLAQPAMEAAAFPSVLASATALVVGISVSGKVERTIEAVKLHASRGGPTVSISAHVDSDLALAAETRIGTRLRGTPGPVPGTANYLGSLLGLIAIADEFAERLGSRPVGGEWLNTALTAITEVAATHGDLADRLIADLTPPFFALGSGPDLGAACYGVAKFIEAAATVGVAQDLEEWAHEQYFTTVPGTTVFLHTTDPAIHDRATRVGASALKVGARLVTIGPARLDLPGESHWQLPDLPVSLSPLVNWVPMATAALAYARAADRHPFGIDLPQRMQTVDEDIYLAQPSRA